MVSRTETSSSQLNFFYFPCRRVSNQIDLVPIGWDSGSELVVPSPVPRAFLPPSPLPPPPPGTVQVKDISASSPPRS